MKCVYQHGFIFFSDPLPEVVERVHSCKAVMQARHEKFQDIKIGCHETDCAAVFFSLHKNIYKQIKMHQ